MKFGYTSYEGAPLATMVSFVGRAIGSLMVLSGVMALFSKELMGIPIAALGIGIGIGAELLSGKIAEHTQFQKWWKKVKKANLEPQIAANLNVAIDIYNKNPQQRTLDKITALNPAAGEYIRRNKR
ncbi:MAG: hypothetical protein Q4F17_08575 [Eubacteriales bacterium]|nr:hypothetical protein [Eubacteriales bacterium]